MLKLFVEITIEDLIMIITQYYQKNIMDEIIELSKSDVLTK